MPTKEIHLSVEIAAHDFEVKVAQARSLLRSPMNLRISVDRLEPSQERLAAEVLGRFIAAVEDTAAGTMPVQRGAAELVAVIWSV